MTTKLPGKNWEVTKYYVQPNYRTAPSSSVEELVDWVIETLSDLHIFAEATGSTYGSFYFKIKNYCGENLKIRVADHESTNSYRGGDQDVDFDVNIGKNKNPYYNFREKLEDMFAEIFGEENLEIEKFEKTN